ncbi:MAG TPA: DUF72 domain-containing protein [Sulfuricella sp.]|nr:DUF72 domain-containing protein [Sulfuricella sp.]
MSGRAFIGTSGWNYPEWRDSFYGGIPARDWLGFYARHFDAVEVNATFYRHQRRSTFEHWREQTPANFVFAIKGHRYLTHVKRLAEAEQSLATSREAAAGLGNKLAVVLWQTPRSLHKDLARLERFAQALSAWPEVRHVLEFRHASWFDAEVAGCLRGHRLANCLSDAVDWPLWDAVTTDLVYVRLHGHARTYASAYGDGELGDWAGRIRVWLAEGRNVHVYFDNTAAGAALHNALRLKEML